MTRLTDRCFELLRFLAVARWLTPSQIKRRFFAGATIQAARKRLRSLERGRYIHRVRRMRMLESLLTLGPEAKRILESRGSDEITLLRRAPKQLEHLLGINDLRIAAELLSGLEFFFACWELPSLDWKHPLIPDALIGVAGRTFAMEFDRGQEGLRYFAKTKVNLYRQGLPGVQLGGVLVIADTEARMKSLRRACVPPPSMQLLFSTLNWINRHGLRAPVFSGAEGEEICPF